MSTSREEKRVVAVGYRFNEIAELSGKLDYRADIVKTEFTPAVDNFNPGTRRIEMVSAGCHVESVCCPHPDTADPHTLRAGVQKRMGQILPVANRAFYRRLRNTVMKWIKSRRIEPFSVDIDRSFASWLERTNYDGKRKEELKKIHEDIVDFLERDRHGALKFFKVKLFAKDETYTTWKHARGIYAREDVAKVYFGPYVKLMEDVAYSQPEFIKHVPVRERAKYIMEKLYVEGGHYIATDYSSFEATFVQQLMLNCEMVLYEHLLGNLPEAPELLGVMREVWTGVNVIQNKFLHCTVIASRMSGEMTTSLGNGFSNLMLMTHACRILGVECRGVVEGDDGLFVFLPGSKFPDAATFARFGCIIKLDVYERISDASFCGQLFDPIDQEIITDPMEVLSRIAWLNAKYAAARSSKLKALLRCKALSYYYQYPACPIVTELALYCLRVSAGCDVRNVLNSVDSYKKELVLKALDCKVWREERKPIGIQTRLLVAEKYNIPITVQLEIENLLERKNDLSPLSIPSFVLSCPDSWLLYSEKYTTQAVWSEYSRSNLLWAPTLAA